MTRYSIIGRTASWPRRRRGVSRVHMQSDVNPLNLPGGDLIAAGLRDLDANRESVAALLVSIGAPRLRGLGFHVPIVLDGPEHRLYATLARENPASAHSRYNALVRRLVSFERAAECVR